MRKKIVLIPDSFKGTMTSQEVCQIMESSIRKFIPDAEVVSIPVADGGEGSIDALQTAAGGERITLNVRGPNGGRVDADYVLLKNRIAVIEMAQAAGLPLMEDKLNVIEATTYGVGELLLDALKHKPKEVIIALGGSATNDGGAGACAALGVRFFDRTGNSFIPVGGSLEQIARIDVSGLIPDVKDTAITVMTDVDNPLCGENGASYVFAPQKGATPETVQRLDKGLHNYALRIQEAVGIDVLDVPGSGAAGGMGGGLYGLLNAQIKMGIDVVLDAADFDEKIADAVLVFTGEGKIDSQSFRGKVISGVAKRTKQQNIPLIAVVGDIGDEIERAYEAGVSAVVSINRVAKPYREIRTRSKSDLGLTMDEVMRLLCLGKKLPGIFN